MMWQCTACEFAANEDGQDACVACGSERQESPSANGAAANGGDGLSVVVIELPAKEKLGVKLIPPKDGVIKHGLAIDDITNPLLDGKVQAGDLIVAIGGQNVDGKGFSDAIDLIRKLPRPLAISFEIDEARRQEVVREKFQRSKENDLDKELTTYAVVFDDGPMGLNLEEAVRYGIDGAVVRALKGQAKTSGMISIGDIVYKVNDVEVLCMPYDDVMGVLRNAATPKTLQFVPKDKLADVQRVDSRHSESFRIRESMSAVKQKLMQNLRLVKDIDNNDAEDSRSIAQLILENQAATIKKGRMYKQGRVMRAWKSFYFVLSVSKMEYFKNPSSTTSHGELNFLNRRCTVRSLPGTSDVVCKSPNVLAEYLLELRVDDRRMVMACTSDSDKKGWMDAIKLAIDASKTVNRAQSLGESLREAKALRTQRTESLSLEGSQTFLDRNAGGRLSHFNYEAFATPVVHVVVISATNLAKHGSTVNSLCEVTVGAETFMTSVVKGQRSPVWKQDNSASFEAPNESMVIEIRVFNVRVFLPTELISALTIPLKSLPNMQKSTKRYPLALGSRSAGAVLTLSLEYVNKAKAYVEGQSRSRFDSYGGGVLNERDEMTKIKADAQLAADEASQYAARAEEEARTLLEQATMKAEAAMAAAREEQAQGKAAVEAAIAEAKFAKEEAEKQAAEARRTQEEARKLIEANQRIQEQSNKADGPSVFAPYRQLIVDGVPIEEVMARMSEDGVDDTSINAFVDGINSYDEKIRALQAEVEKLKRSRSSRPKEGQRAQDMLTNLDTSSDQIKLPRRFYKLDNRLQQADTAVATDIPYEEVKTKVEEIAKRMAEIGSADVTHPDPVIQKQLRKEYFCLEQDMEKYNTTLILTNEHAAEEARNELKWEKVNYDENSKEKNEKGAHQVDINDQIVREIKRLDDIDDSGADGQFNGTEDTTAQVSVASEMWLQKLSGVGQKLHYFENNIDEIGTVRQPSGNAIFGVTGSSFFSAHLDTRIAHIPSDMSSSLNSEFVTDNEDTDEDSQMKKLLTLIADRIKLVHEAAPLYQHVLFRLQTLVVDIYGKDQCDEYLAGMEGEIRVISTRLKSLLDANINKSVVYRLVSVRTVIDTLGRFHSELDRLEAIHHGKILYKWLPQWEVQAALVKQSIVACAEESLPTLVNELSTDKQQIEAMTLLLCELKHNKRFYSRTAQDVIYMALNRIMGFSKVPVTGVEEWFIPRHEVEIWSCDVLGRGSFGVVYRGMWRKSMVVVKCLTSNSDADNRAFFREVGVWHRIRHRNIVPFLGACHLASPYFMVCEFAPGGSLMNYLYKQRKDGKVLVWRKLHEVAVGLFYLHNERIVHGDLKGDNILVAKDGTAMLTDFGLSFVQSATVATVDKWGAIRWRAPEYVVQGGAGPSPAADVYSLAMVIVEAVTGQAPWGVMPDIAVTMCLRKKEMLKRPVNCAEMTDNAWDLVSSMSVYEPTERMSLDVVVDRLKDLADDEEDREWQRSRAN